MKLTIENIIIFLVSVMFLFVLVLVVQNLKHNFVKQENNIEVNYFFKADKLYITGLLSKKMRCNVVVTTFDLGKYIVYNKSMSYFDTFFRFNFPKSSSNKYNYTISCCSVNNNCFTTSNIIFTIK